MKKKNIDWKEYAARIAVAAVVIPVLSAFVVSWGYVIFAMIKGTC